MSKLFFCIGNKAMTPYCMAAEHIRFFSIEEVCYYICERAEIMSDELMRGSLVDFIETQLGLSELAQMLEQLIRMEEPLHVFCNAILEYVGYPDAVRREQVIQRIRENETLPVIRRLQKQAETYRDQKRYDMAQKAYRSMLLREDVQSDRALVAEIYERIGKLAALLFQYETAAYCFDKSCQYADKSEVRKQYLLCQRFMMSKEQYLEWLAERKEYYECSVDAIREYERAKQTVAEQMQGNNGESDLNQIKEEYRRMALE